VEHPGYDKLLFRREDFQTPERSPLYGELLNLGSDVRDLAEQLFAFGRAPMEDVPPLTQLVGSYAKVERLLRAREWHAAVDLLNRRGHFRDAPEGLRSLIHEAYEFVCREKAWKEFSEIPEEASEKIDRELVEKWNDALFAGFPPAEKERMRVAEARRRVSLLDRVRHFVQRTGGQITLAGEKSLVTAAAQLPQGYRHSLEKRVELARRRAHAMARLERVLADPEGEASIIAAWRAVVEAKCEQFVSIESGMRIGLAEERLPLLRALVELPADLPSDQRDAEVLAIWKDDLLKDCPEAAHWRGVYQRAKTRKKILEQLRAAIEAQDETNIAKFAEQRWLEKYSLPEGWMEMMHTARERMGRLRTMLDALRGGNGASDNGEAAGKGTTAPETPAPASPASVPPAPLTFREAFDVRVLRDYAGRFAPYQAVLSEWIRTEILALDNLGLQLPAEQPGLTPLEEPAGSFRAQWNWPDERLADGCVLAVCAAEPDAEADPETIAAQWRAVVRREEWTAGGSSRTIAAERDWDGSCVVVWAMLDAGFRKFHSPPLVLGRIEHRSRWGWMRLFSRRTEAAPPEEPQKT
jgi:hypothetical protein